METNESTPLDNLSSEWELLARRIRARIGVAPPPETLLSRVQGIPFVVGERVIDTITGEEVTVAGTGIVNIERGG